MTPEVYRNIQSASLQGNASSVIRRKFIMQQDNKPKHNKGLFDWPSQSPDPIERAFYLKQTTTGVEQASA